MKRRTFLVLAVATGSLPVLSGCTVERLQEAEREPPPFEGVDAVDRDLPVLQRLEVAAAEIEEAADAVVGTVEELVSHLEGLGLRVETLDEDEGEPVLSLEYVVEEATDRGSMHHLGVVAGGYAALVAASDTEERLEASVLDPETGKFGEYEIRPRWAEEYDAGEISARRYANEIAVTVESNTEA